MRAIANSMVNNPDFLTYSQDQVAPEFQQLESPEGELHLRFYVATKQEFALSATGIKEVISPSPDRITPIPNASALILGTLNLRGRVIWVADLGQFLGNTTPLNTDRPEIPVVAIEEQDTIVGLAVDEIIGMDWLDAANLQPPSNAPDSMAPFLRGEWLLDGKKDQCLRLLDQLALIRTARWVG